MRASWSRVSAAAVVALPALVSAGAAVEPRAGPAPSTWVTVVANGQSSNVVAATITPSVTGSSTISAPPSYLTQTGTYTMIAGAQTTTSTGLPPVASPTGSGPGGAFLACNNYQGPGAPFCQPRRGSQLAQGRTYYVTWDPNYFAPPNTLVMVQADYGSRGGFTSANISASQGYYIWTIDSALLQKSPANANLSLYLSYADGNDEVRVPRGGLAVTIVNPPPTGSGVSAVAVAVPVVIAVVLLGLLGFCFWSWRRHGQWPLIGALASRRRSQGYGVRKSHSQRTGAAAGLSVGTGRGVGSGKGGAGIQLTPRESWSPTQGRNVFREEIRRQDGDAH